MFLEDRGFFMDYYLTSKGQERLQSLLEIGNAGDLDYRTTVDTILLRSIDNRDLESLYTESSDRGSRKILITSLNRLEDDRYIEYS